MGDLTGRQFRKVAYRLHFSIDGRELVDRDRQQFFVTACLVDHFQHADWPAAHHDTRDQREWRNHQNIDRIAVVRQRVRNVAVVARIVHGRGHEAVDEQGACRLVQFILDGITVHRNLDNDVDVIRYIAAGINSI